MAVKEKSRTNYDLGNSVGDFFSLPVDLPSENITIGDDIKKRIYALDVDPEEKANMLNKISVYNSISNVKEKNKIKKEIDSFLEINE